VRAWAVIRYRMGHWLRCFIRRIVLAAGAAASTRGEAKRRHLARLLRAEHEARLHEVGRWREHLPLGAHARLRYYRVMRPSGLRPDGLLPKDFEDDLAPVVHRKQAC